MSPVTAKVRTGADPREVERVVRKTFSDIRAMFRQQGETLDSETAEKLVTESAPKLPGFPFLWAGLAFIKDALDAIATISVIGIIFTYPLSIGLGVALFLWTLGKMSGGWWKKAIIRWVWVRFGLVLIIEMIPFVQIIPANTIFILMVHYKETKIVKLLNRGLEALHGSGVFEYVRR